VYKAITKSGAKSYQRRDTEDRSLEFRLWHRDLDKSLYATDIDLVEIRIINNIPTPVATLEITRVDAQINVSNNYLQSIIERFEKRDFQKKMAIHLARMLKVKAWIILYREGCNEFWVHCLSEQQKKEWYHFDKERMERWLKSLEPTIDEHPNHHKNLAQLTHI